MNKTAATLFAAGLFLASALSSQADVHYVDLNSTNATPPYANWATAATNIQDAVDAAVAGDEVVVTNGTYATGGRGVYGTTNRVAVDKPLTLRSVNGPELTIINGGGIRCVYLTNGASLSGFTLTGGVASFYTPSVTSASSGGGVWCESLSALVSNCVLTGNSASGEGGGAYQGTLNTCTLNGNRAQAGGGAFGGMLNNCTLSGNSASASARLLRGGTIGQDAAASGGGASGCTLNNCVLNDNSASTYPGEYYYFPPGSTVHRSALGGGAYDCTVDKCTLAGNSCYNQFGFGFGPLTVYTTANGGGAYGCALNNCTLTNSQVWNSYESYFGDNPITAYSTALGGGASESTLTNCAVSDNHIFHENDYYPFSIQTTNHGDGTSGGALSNCTLNRNSAYQGTLNNCTLTGGGAYISTLNNCALAGNGPGASGCTLNNCTLVGNALGAHNSTLTNCISYFNAGANYDLGCTLDHCCTTPLPPAGVGNISDDPQLASTSHLSVLSPCIGKGDSAAARGTDIDGDVWTSPPSIGCDDYHDGAVTGSLRVAISASYTSVLVGYPVDFTALIGGRTDLSVWAFGDGAVEINQPYVTHSWPTPGDYLVSLWTFSDSYPGGISTNVTIHVVLGLHYVAANSANPVAPYSSWATAATNLQDAINAAPEPGAQIFVTNGTYGPITTGNRMSVRSVNGAQFTMIDGGHSNRCASLGQDISLTGFTLTNGNSPEGGGGASGGTLTDCALIGNSATNSYGGPWGGGAAGCALNNCTLRDNSAGEGGGTFNCTLNKCTLSGNSAAIYGGGASGSTLTNCALAGNSATNWGGGAYGCVLNNCALFRNSASDGGGAFYCTLNNCTLTGNSATNSGGGASWYCSLYNCITYLNTAPNGANYDSYWSVNYCCTAPLPTNGVGNVTNAPLFVNTNGWANLRLQSNSPCINAGNNSYVANATDLDGNPRIAGGSVDLGAYEFESPASRISYAWLQQFNLPINPSTDAADPDGDGVDNWHEWLAVTDPTNPRSSPAQLTITASGAHLVLTWPTNAVGFTLQSTTKLDSTAAWSTNSPAPIVIAGQNTVTNPITGAQQFYRLVQ